MNLYNECGDDVHKGCDRAMIQTRSISNAPRNKIDEFQDARSIGASEACWRLFNYDLSARESVVPLHIHLENRQIVRACGM